MKGIQGIVIALGLGVVGAVCNFLYVSQQARDFEKVAFVSIATDARINLGDLLKEEHFQKVEIPRQNIGNLDKVAVLWTARGSAAGMRATRSYLGGEILLQQELRTPAARDSSDLLGEDEVLRWVPIDPRSIVAEHVNPGNYVSFEVQIFGTQQAEPPDPSETTQNPAADSVELIGPFEIMSLGSRKGRREFLAAQGVRSGQGNPIGIRVKLIDGKMEEKAERLFEALRLSGGKGVQILLHSSKMEPK